MAGETTNNYEENLKKLGELIKGIKIAMLTSEDADGVLRSRPMATQDVEFDGTLWFLSGGNTQKAQVHTGVGRRGEVGREIRNGETNRQACRERRRRTERHLVRSSGRQHARGDRDGPQ